MLFRQIATVADVIDEGRGWIDYSHSVVKRPVGGSYPINARLTWCKR